MGNSLRIRRMIINKTYKDSKIIDKQQCLETLLDAGLRIKDEDKIEFTESHTFGIDMGKNNRKLFKPLLQGRIIIDSNNRLIKWHLKLDGIIFKTLMSTIMGTLAIRLVVENNWIAPLITGVICGLVIFLFNWVNLETRLNKLTAKMTLEK